MFNVYEAQALARGTGTIRVWDMLKTQKIGLGYVRGTSTFYAHIFIILNQERGGSKNNERQRSRSG